MDPLGALSVAAAMVQFAEFGCNLIKGADQVYRSATGRSKENIELSSLSLELIQLVDDVESKLDEGWVDPNAPAPASLVRLCQDCRDTQGALGDILESLEAKGTTRITRASSSFLVAIKGINAAPEIEKLLKRLSQIREQAMMAILCLLLDEAKRNGVNLGEFAQQQADMIATLDRIDQTTKKFSTDLVDFIRVKSRSKMDNMIRYVMSNKWDANKNMKALLLDSQASDEVTRAVLEDLFFEPIGHREAEIPPKYTQTLEWIFREPRRSNDGSQLWSSLPKWLQGDSKDVYWITGKPGAGKSTLLKFVSRDCRFKKYLQQWADGTPLLVTHYFSWTAGNKLQKSHEGLLRTILFEALSFNEHLLPRLFPGRCFLLQVFNREMDIPLTMDELTKASNALLSSTDCLKIAIVIDGLDEFDGDHSKLVDFLRKANENDNVKICASSRPWNIFKDEYLERNPMLQLEKLTREDITLFVEGTFRKSLGFREFEGTNPRMARKLTGDIIEKAQGVFLWVAVVCSLLETSFRDGCSMAELQRTIDGLPNEVLELFQYIWKRTSDRFRQEASQYFQIMRSAANISVTPYALTIFLGDQDISLDLSTNTMTIAFLNSAVAMLERKLNSRTGGLLEIVETNKGPAHSRVAFMHRTARDWVYDNWEGIYSSTATKFDPAMWIFKGEVLRMRSGTVSVSIPRYIQSLVDIASELTDHPSNRPVVVALLDSLNQHQVERVSLSDHLWRHSSAFASSQERKQQRNITVPGSHHQYGFIGLAAEIPIAPYLTYAAKETPQVLATIPIDISTQSTSILMSLIFGYFYHARASFNIARLFPADSLLRLELLQAVLQNGVSAQDLTAIYRAARTKYDTMDYGEQREVHLYFERVFRILEMYVVREERLVAPQGEPTKPPGDPLKPPRAESTSKKETFLSRVWRYFRRL